jgi:hypothetical protein
VSLGPPRDQNIIGARAKISACTRTSVAANVIRSAVPIFRTKSTAVVAGLIRVGG